MVLKLDDNSSIKILIVYTKCKSFSIIDEFNTVPV